MHRLSAIAAALALATGACGGSSSPGDSGAELLPADTAAFVSIDTTFDSEQWERVRSLVAKFPDGDKVGEFILEGLSDEGVDFEDDVKPALGPTVDLAVLDFEELNSAPFVLLTQSEDPAKLRELVERGGQEVVLREAEGWSIVAESDAVIDRILEGGESLQGSERFEEAMGAVEDDALATLYLNGQSFQEAFQRESAAELAPLFALNGETEWIVAALRAEEGGARLVGTAKATGEEQSEPYADQLAGEVPGNALVYVSFNDLERSLDRLKGALAGSVPNLDQGLGQFEAFVGVSLEEDVFPLFARQGALYVRSGGTIPEVSLVLQTEDEEGARRTLDKLADAAAFVGARKGDPVEVDGVSAAQVVYEDFPIYYAVFDGRVVVTTAPTGISGLREEGDKLADDEDFQRALEAAGVPDETTGYAYVDLAAAIPVVTGFVQARGESVPPEVGRNLEPLDALVLSSSRDGDETTVTVFLGID